MHYFLSGYPLKVIQEGISEKDIALDQLRVVHFSTGHSGGAGLAARRLNAELNQYDVPSSFYALKRNGYTPNSNEYEISRSIFRRLSSFFLLTFQKHFSTKMLFSSLSSNAKSYRYFRKFQDAPNTILHFHNWTNLISEKNLLKLMARRANVVITTHDERIITGGCHYKFDCTLASSGCKSCPLVNLQIGKKLIHISKKRKDDFLESNPLLAWVIAPSLWIQKEIMSAKIFEARKNNYIQNTLGPDWNTHKYLRTRTEGDSPLIIGIASMDTSSFVKAGDIVSFILTSPLIKKMGFEFLVLNQIPESEQFEKFWMRIDSLLALTRADNSPNVIWEALSLHIPVISVNLGGIPEISSPEQIYLLDKAEDAVSFLENDDLNGAKYFIQNARFNPTRSLEISAENHKNLYMRILNQAFIGDNKCR
jgi:hypothetical protein